VRTAALTEFASSDYPVRIDNGDPLPNLPNPPGSPAITLQLQAPDGTRTDLGCCEKVEQGGGNLIVVGLQGWDENFSRIGVQLLGGCGAAYDIVATDGTALSKTYNGDRTDTGYPVLTEFLWNPWDPNSKVDPCCYLIYVSIYDRAILNNSYSGGHGRANWHSITIA